jgi:predicted nuclease of predicted toxin-antitoxin system
MRFLADENVEFAVVQGLARAGHDIVPVGPQLRSRADARVLDAASRARRVVITNDKDFADLAFRERRASSGIVLVRLPRWGGARKADRVVEALAQVGSRLTSGLTVVEESGVRFRPFLTG